MSSRFLAAVVVLAAAGAWAQVPSLSASLGYSSEVFMSRSWDMVDDDDHLPMLRVGGGTTFEVAQGFLDVEAAFQSGASRVQTHSFIPTEFWLRGVRVGAAYRYPLFRYLQPYVHLGAGVDWATLTLFSAQRLTQTVVTGVGTGLVGAQVPVRLGKGDGRRPFLVLDVGFGGVVRPSAAFTSVRPEAPAKPPEDPVGQGAVNVGSMPLTGLTFRVLATARW